jgi:AcrR family transcriptional regulator
MSTTRAPAFTRLDPEGRRRQILAAAGRVFSERPYGSVSMNDIAREAGVTRGLLHHYFGGKAQLYGALLESLAAVALAPSGSAGGIPLEELIAVHVEAWLDFITEHRELALTIGAGMYPEDPELEGIVQNAREAIVDWIARTMAIETDREEELHFLIRSYLGLTGAAAREWLYHQRATRDDVRAMFTYALIALVQHTLPALPGRR